MRPVGLALTYPVASDGHAAPTRLGGQAISPRVTKGMHNVARDTDFLDLYRILGLQPGCGLDEFKRAYRRRVSVLHPDRRHNDPGNTIASERLQQLTAMYGMAMEFQREHGRLPGAPQVRTSTQASPTSSSPAARQTTVRSTQRRSVRWWLFVPAAAIVVWLLWPGQHHSATSPSTAELAHPAVRQSSSVTAVATSPLSLGMDAATVRASEGEPTLTVNNERWEYGPSWIRFERGKVVDWYSSPLYPLHTTTRSPSPGEN